MQLKSDPDQVIDTLVPVVSDLVDSLPAAPYVLSLDGSRDWAPRTVQAAVMLTARLYRRRNSPNGVEALTEGGATYVSRYDPDIAQMLRTGRFAPPRAR